MPDSKPIRLLVVDDHFVVRMGLTASLNAEPDMQVVAEASSAAEAYDMCTRHQPNLVLMDVRLPGTDGIEAAQHLLKGHPHIRVLMLSTNATEEYVFRALQAGAHGYVLKSALREELLFAVREAHAGRQYIDRSASYSLAERMGRQELTARELDVLKMVVKGLSNKEIATSLDIAEVTVKLHVSHVLEKLKVTDRTQAVRAALQRGLVSLG